MDSLQSGYAEASQMQYWASKQDLVIVEALRPKISKDGDQWCVLYGDNLQEGVSGFGNTPMEAIQDFNSAMYKN